MSASVVLSTLAVASSSANMGASCSKALDQELSFTLLSCDMHYKLVMPVIQPLVLEELVRLSSEIAASRGHCSILTA